MGHTHYWYYNRPFTNEEWQLIVTGFFKLRQALPDVRLANVGGSGKPVVSGDYLGFNELATQAVEPFELFRTREAWEKRMGNVNGRKWRGSCKTEQQPYDLVVMALLLMVSEIAPGALNV